MKPMLLVVGLFACAVSVLQSQNLQRPVERVSVLSMPGRAGTKPHNLGWVEFRDHILVVDVCDSVAWQAVDEILTGTRKPIRYAVHTVSGTVDDCLPSRTGVIALASAGTLQTVVDMGRVEFSEDVTIDDGYTKAKLRQATSHPTGQGWTLTTGENDVLFAGRLIGPANSSSPLPLDDWISELSRLERLAPRIVVPRSGLIGGPDMIGETRDVLLRSRSVLQEMVDAGSSRELVVSELRSVAGNVLPRGLAERLYDEYTGLAPANAFIQSVGLREGPSPTVGDPEWTPPRKVVVADMWPGRTWQIGLAAPGIEVVVARNSDDAAELVMGADAIIGWLTPEILARGNQLRWVALFSAGVESYLAVPGLVESDIVLTNGQRLYANGGAEHVLSMALALSRRLHTAVLFQRESRWDNTPLTGPTPITGDGSELGELRGKTLLVAGLGGIGTEVARLAHGIGMRVIATRASRREGPPFVEYVGLSNELKQLAGEADVIVNCLPLTAETETVFSDDLFSATKPTGYFVNIGRGKTVDTDALVRALHGGRIAGAALDVTDPEPLPSDHELWDMPNVIITPHVGGDSERHMQRIWLLFRENLRRFALGEPLLSVVNKLRGY